MELPWVEQAREQLLAERKIRQREQVRAGMQRHRDKMTAEQKDEYRAYMRAARRKSRYGITDEQLEAIHAAQGGRCAICSRLFSDVQSKNPRHIDHCHSSGKVRGLLCHHCNAAEGLLRSAGDPAVIAARLIEYLKAAA